MRCGIAVLFGIGWLILPAAQPHAAETSRVLPSVHQLPRIAVVRRIGCPAYEKVIDEFRSGTRAVVRVLPALGNDGGALKRWLERYRPDVVLAVGQSGYDSVREIRGLPIVHTLAFNRLDKAHIEVSTRVPARAALSAFRQAKPGGSVIAMLVGKDTQGLAAEARAAAKAMDIDLRVRTASSPRSAVRKLRTLERDLDGLWLVPDLSILSPQVFQYSLRLQLKRQLPLMGAVQQHVLRGALLALDYDPHETGRRCARVVNSLLAGERGVRAEEGRPKLFANLSAASALHIPRERLAAAAYEVFE